MQLGEKPPQSPVIGLVQALDALQRIVDRNAPVVDFLRVADHARNRPQAAGNAHRARIGEGGQAAVEHARIELVGLAVDVNEAAREMGAHQRIAALDDAGDQIVDEAIFGTAQACPVPAAKCEELARIGRAAMGGIEQDRAGAFGRLDDLERRIELVARRRSWRTETLALGYQCENGW